MYSGTKIAVKGEIAKLKISYFFVWYQYLNLGVFDVIFLVDISFVFK